MSMSLLYHGFGIRGCQHVKTAYEAGMVTFTILQERGAFLLEPVAEARSLGSGEDIGEQLGRMPQTIYLGAPPPESADPRFLPRNADFTYTGFNGLLTSPSYNRHKSRFLNELWMVAWSACQPMTTTSTTNSGLSG